MNFFDGLKNIISKEWKTGHLIYHFHIANYVERKKYTLKDEQIKESKLCGCIKINICFLSHDNTFSKVISYQMQTFSL